MDSDAAQPAVVQLVRDNQPAAVLEELLFARGERLLHTAILLAGSHADGEDLLQAALERVFRHWRRIEGNPEGYLRATLCHLAADGWRRKGALLARLPLVARAEAQPDHTAPVEQRDQLIRLLRDLPPRQRTAIVLRYWEDLTEAEAARLMDCSVGTVKAATSRGLRRLRELSEATGVRASGLPEGELLAGVKTAGGVSSGRPVADPTAASTPQSPASTTGSAS
ncbi:MAG TPA: SigE family RNA polymerase sigma factor [Trebonia sp.]|nr:SigE family RNA polymerase sigma factor [Trebonia sp.]